VDDTIRVIVLYIVDVEIIINIICSLGTHGFEINIVVTGKVFVYLGIAQVFQLSIEKLRRGGFYPSQKLESHSIFIQTIGFPGGDRIFSSSNGKLSSTKRSTPPIIFGRESSKNDGSRSFWTLHESPADRQMV
jgi:hypothetical protein